jgi:hypothetical protein
MEEFMLVIEELMEIGLRDFSINMNILDVFIFCTL